ncbi:diphthine--ammonia ligase-like [Rutidosis leptorrhynchoides]|uniref:diphthine--ammonia ligase-like n=1 Tax=Rutidosis leptorrhynchoides TaxID=125765 RepID=UPI003A9A2E5E
MKVVGLVSGGKDSCFAMMKCLQYGHEVVALANLLPANDSVDELDSYMYQTVGHQIVVSYANCMGVPLFRRRIQGSTRRHDLSYNTTIGDEVEDMFILLKEVKKQLPSINAVSSGAIASDYQRLRVENVCSRLGLVSLAYLWKLDQSLLLQQMIENGIVAITVKVAAIGLDPSKHLGKEMSELWPHLLKLNELYGSNVCGEGGEYETLTLDCPLFKYARIVLDDFQLVLHDSNSIAPVGILHPVSFHCEDKPTSRNTTNGFYHENLGSVIEVQNESLEIVKEDTCPSSDLVFNLPELEKLKPCISKTQKDNTFTLSCWLQDPNQTSVDLQEDMKIVLLKIESELNEHGFSWENVVYIHLYISDMNIFAIANETYVNFITQEKCRFGVPSRSTIELPLSQVGLGKAYVEVLVANDQSKKVLHVQSISSWAPSCIGPYSQATLHKEILYMAGQLGLDPPTMSLIIGGPTAELEQALVNSEAIANSFNCSISTSAILFVIYCSKSTSIAERIGMQEKQNIILDQMKLVNLDKKRLSGVLNPLLLFVLVPDLPKRAFVEVKPVLFVDDDDDTEIVEDANDHVMSDRKHRTSPFDLCFQSEKWHDECVQECFVHGRICAVILSITTETANKICFNADNLPSITVEEKTKRVAKFCVYRLDKVLSENHFSWDDLMNLRIYYSTSHDISHETLSLIFKNVFDEFSETTKKVKTCNEPIFNVVPVIGSGSSATCMDDFITCELVARRT